MTRIDEYRQQLRLLKDWHPFLMKNSGLPGPRGNLELAAAAAREATENQIKALLAIPPDEAPENSPGVFLVFCGVLSLGKLIAAGDQQSLKQLRHYASDPRWRVREAVAMALQTLGDADAGQLVRVARDWSRGGWLEKRAAAAGIAEPRLLGTKTIMKSALEILDFITNSMGTAEDRRDPAYKVLRQGMSYCWSVVVAADLAVGKPYLERWLKNTDPDIRWIMRENLKKNRLARLEPDWVRRGLALLS